MALTPHDLARRSTSGFSPPLEPPRGSWWAEPDVQRDRVAFMARQQRERRRMQDGRFAASLGPDGFTRDTTREL